LPKQVTTSTSTSTSNIRDADISPLFFKIAARTFPKLSPSNNNLRQPPQQPDPNTIEDQKMAQYIVDNLKSNELSTGQEFTANDLENIIRNRFAGVNDNIVKLAIDMILNDAENMKSRVAGSFDNFTLLVSARKPTFGKQPSTQQLQQQQSPQHQQKKQPSTQSQQLQQQQQS